MRITEDLMVGRKFFGKSAYLASINETLSIVLGTTSRLGTSKVITIFPKEHESPWRVREFGNTLEILDHTPVRHRVYSIDELEFILAYEELDGLSLELMESLAEKHSRCTFEVTANQFMGLFKQLPLLVSKYKFSSNIYNMDNDPSKLIDNYMIGISFYKLNTFLYDIYGNNPEGYGIAFEFMDKKKSHAYPAVVSGYYIVLTDMYEGVFYIDGKDRLKLIGTDFKRRIKYFKNIVDFCNIQHVKKKPKKVNLFEGLDYAKEAKELCIDFEDAHNELKSLHESAPIPQNMDNLWFDDFDYANEVEESPKVHKSYEKQVNVKEVGESMAKSVGLDIAHRTYAKNIRASPLANKYVDRHGNHVSKEHYYAQRYGAYIGEAGKKSTKKYKPKFHKVKVSDGAPGIALPEEEVKVAPKVTISNVYSYWDNLATTTSTLSFNDINTIV